MYVAAVGSSLDQRTTNQHRFLNPCRLCSPCLRRLCESELKCNRKKRREFWNMLYQKALQHELSCKAQSSPTGFLEDSICISGPLKDCSELRQHEPGMMIVAQRRSRCGGKS